jgi:SAM-dependent methyltransferase
VAPELKRRSPASVAARLRAGEGCSDDEFDQVYGRWHRMLSPYYWTPVAIAFRAAQLLTSGGRRRVLDVGSGVGKFCIVGALTTQSVFVGVERRPKLVVAARTAASLLEARRTVFVPADFTAVDFEKFDAFYLFNPFEELVSEGIISIDNGADVAPDRFEEYVAAVMTKLRRAPRASRVLTYFGYGGPRPPGFKLLHREAAGEDALTLWQKE